MDTSSGTPSKDTSSKPSGAGTPGGKSPTGAGNGGRLDSEARKMDRSNNNTSATQLVIENKTSTVSAGAPQVYQIIGGATVATVAGQPQLQGPVNITSTVTTVTTVPMAIPAGTTILSVQQGAGKLDDKNKKSKDKADKHKVKTTVLQARPIVPAAVTVTTSLAPVTTHAQVSTMATATAGLKPIQPKPTILGETSRVDPALQQLKDSKKPKKKKNKDKDSPPHPGKPVATQAGNVVTPVTGSKDGNGVKLEGKAHPVAPGAPGQVVAPGPGQQSQPHPATGHPSQQHSMSVIKTAASPLKPPAPAGEGVDLRTSVTPQGAPSHPQAPQGVSGQPMNTQSPRDLSKRPVPPSSDAAKHPSQGPVGHKHPSHPGHPSHGGQPTHLSPVRDGRHPHGASRNNLSPLQVATEGREHHGEARSPAYSDISDDGAPAPESDHHSRHREHSRPGIDSHGQGTSGKPGERGAPQGDQANNQAPGSQQVPPGYGVYRDQYYSQNPYLVPSNVPHTASPGQQQPPSGPQGAQASGSRQNTPGPKDQGGPDGKPQSKDSSANTPGGPSGTPTPVSRPGSRDSRDMSRPASQDSRDGMGGGAKPHSETGSEGPGKPGNTERPPSLSPSEAEYQRKLLHQQQMAYQYQQYVQAGYYPMDPAQHHHLFTTDPVYRQVKSSLF